jgi:DNA polymerase-3 subunit beta
MKFILNSKQLLERLQGLSGVINAKATIPILDSFLFKIDGNKLQITASDLETTMTTEMVIESEMIGNIAIEARILIETLKTLAEQPLTFKVGVNTVKIVSGNGEYEIPFQDGESYPKTAVIENGSVTEIPEKTLLKAISKTIFATGTDDLRPVMCGVLFQLTTEKATFVATDAHKLVKYVRNDIKSSEDADFVVPKKPLNVLKSILGNSDTPVTIEFNQSNAVFKTANNSLICRLIDQKYPNYEAVIPKENPNVLTLDRGKFLSSVKCVAIFSNKTTHQIRLAIKGNELNLSAQDVDYSNRADERMSCNFEGNDMEIGFNSRFLTEMLSNIQSDEVQLAMSMPNRAGILTPIDGLETDESLLMLVMPVMLK